MYFLFDLRPLEKLMCDEIPSDYTLFLEAGDIFLENVILLKWRVLFEQFVDSFGRRCAHSLEFEILFCEFILIFEGSPEIGFEHLLGILFARWKYVAIFEIKHVSWELIELLHKWLIFIQIEVIILPQYLDRFFTHQRHGTLLQIMVQSWGTWIHVIMLLPNLVNPVSLWVFH